MSKKAKNQPFPPPTDNAPEESANEPVPMQSEEQTAERVPADEELEWLRRVVARQDRIIERAKADMHSIANESKLHECQSIANQFLHVLALPAYFQQ